MKHIFEALFSLFKKKPFSFQPEIQWTRQQAEQWLLEHSFKKHKTDSSVWIRREKELNTYISFCVRIFKDGCFTAAILVSKIVGKSYWCSKEQRVSFKNPIVAIRSCENFIEDLEITDGGNEIFDRKKEIVSFSNNRRKWNDSNTSSKFTMIY